MTDRAIICDRSGATQWVATKTADPYGRGVPAGREYWAFQVSGCLRGDHPLRGVYGFYAASLAEAEGRIKA